MEELTKLSSDVPNLIFRVKLDGFFRCMDVCLESPTLLSEESEKSSSFHV